jgi:hypothetical protein
VRLPDVSDRRFFKGEMMIKRESSKYQSDTWGDLEKYLS